MFTQNNFFVYILGYIPSDITIEVRNKFENALRELHNMRYEEIYNPLDTLGNSEINKKMAWKINLDKLFNSNAVYILNDDFERLKYVPELKIALSLNIIIMHQAVPLYKQAPKPQEPPLYSLIE